MNLLKILVVLIGFLTSSDIAWGQSESSQVADEKTLITVHAEDAFLPSILSILAKESGYNIVTDPNVNKQDKVSIHLDEVP